MIDDIPTEPDAQDYRKLHERSCVECPMGTPVMEDSEAERLLMHIPAWRKGFHEEVVKIIREFHFVGFQDAFDFTRNLAALAELHNHHPTILTEWGRVTVYWWSQKLNGLHINDFIMAAKTDALFKAGHDKASQGKAAQDKASGDKAGGGAQS